MTQKPIDWNRPLQTKNGRPVRILAKDLDFPAYPIVAAVKGPVGEVVHLYDLFGDPHSGKRDDSLINVPEKKYIGIYLEPDGKVHATSSFDTEDVVNTICSWKYRKLLKIVEVEIPLTGEE